MEAPRRAAIGRIAVATVLVLLVAGCSSLGWLPDLGVIARSPSPSAVTQPSLSTPTDAPIPSASASPSTENLTWQVVRDATEPSLFWLVSWAHGFAAIEGTHAARQIVLSRDGVEWTEGKLPVTTRTLSLYAWHNELLLDRETYLQGNVRHALWTSNDGVSWLERGEVRVAARTPGYFVAPYKLLPFENGIAIIGRVGPPVGAAAPYQAEELPAQTVPPSTSVAGGRGSPRMGSGGRSRGSSASKMIKASISMSPTVDSSLSSARPPSQRRLNPE